MEKVDDRISILQLARSRSQRQKETILGCLKTKQWSTGRYASHSELTRQESNDRIYKKLEHLIWKYKNKLALPV